ncbi:MAG TPA: phosphoribosylformylglycinamidine cyclo-ligase [Bacteroidota bacterium]
MAVTYVQAGVNIDEGDRFVREIKKNVRSTFTRGVIGDIGAFGGFFDARFKNVRHPVLVSSIDGVGTKLVVAKLMNLHHSVGQDLVNHCVNDILACGARPLFFLDYFATGKLRVEIAAAVVSGMAKACRENGCALIGGETAEMPGMYQEDDYDLAGTIVGMVEKRGIIDGKRIRRGDILIGLPSTGLHTNGFSLARAVLLRDFAVTTFVDELGTTLGEALLAVHRSYLPLIAPMLETRIIRGLAHITGGGIVGNTNRVLPAGRSLNIHWDGWTRPPLFDLIQRVGNVPEADMRRTFNLGIGMILIVGKKDVDHAMAGLRRRREKPVVVGEVV